jgi:putative transcriptional regulator
MLRLMVNSRLDEVLKQREKSLYWLADQVGAKYNSLWRLKQGTALSISFDLLDRICEALDCEVGDILHRTKEGKRQSKKGAAK